MFSERRSRKVVFAALGVVATFSCARSPAVAVERISVDAASLAATPSLGIGAAGFEQAVSRVLKQSGRFVSGAPPAGSDINRVQAEVTFARESRMRGEGHDRDRNRAEVGVALELVRLPDGDGSRAERTLAEGTGQHAVSGSDPDAHGAAFSAALEAALQDATQGLALQLDASGKPEAALIADLHASDARRRGYAIRVLAERRRPAALEPLLNDLTSANPDVVLRTIGALVALGDRRAVRSLIQRSEKRDATFMVQVAYALGTLGGDDAEAYLFAVAHGADDTDVRAAAHEAFEELRRKKLVAARP